MVVDMGAFRGGWVQADERIAARRAENAKLYSEFVRTNPGASVDEREDYAQRLSGRSKGQRASLPSRQTMERQVREYQAMIAAREAAARARAARSRRTNVLKGIAEVSKVASEFAEGSGWTASPEDATAVALQFSGTDIPEELAPVIATRVRNDGSDAFYKQNRSILDDAITDDTFDVGPVFESIGIDPESPYAGRVATAASSRVGANQNRAYADLEGRIPQVASGTEADVAMYRDEVQEWARRANLDEDRVSSLYSRLDRATELQVAQRQREAEQATRQRVLATDLDGPAYETLKMEVERGIASGELPPDTTLLDDVANARGGWEARQTADADVTVTNATRNLTTQIASGEFQTPEQARAAISTLPEFRHVSDPDTALAEVDKAWSTYQQTSVIEADRAAEQRAEEEILAFNTGRGNIGGYGPDEPDAALGLIASSLQGREPPDLEESERDTWRTQTAARIEGQLSELTNRFGLPLNDAGLIMDVIERASYNVANPELGGGQDGDQMISAPELRAAYHEAMMARSEAAPLGIPEGEYLYASSYRSTLDRMGYRSLEDAVNDTGRPSATGAFRDAFEAEVRDAFRLRSDLIDARRASSFEDVEGLFEQATMELEGALGAWNAAVAPRGGRGRAEAVDSLVARLGRGEDVSPDIMEEAAATLEGDVVAALTASDKAERLAQTGRATIEAAALQGDTQRYSAAAERADRLSRTIMQIEAAAEPYAEYIILLRNEAKARRAAMAEEAAAAERTAAQEEVYSSTPGRTLPGVTPRPALDVGALTLDQMLPPGVQPPGPPPDLGLSDDPFDASRALDRFRF